MKKLLNVVALVTTMSLPIILGLSITTGVDNYICGVIILNIVWGVALKSCCEQQEIID
jgi:hypothetical protein